MAKVKIDDWRELFEIIETGRGAKKIIIIWDEFQWMCAKKSSLISALQEQWDQKWKQDGKTFLILCGSIISFMEKNILFEKSPLYGRRTASFELEPMPAETAKQFFPRKSVTEQAEIIMTLGGIPSYLELINSKESLPQNLNRLGLVKDGYFVNEVQFVLREQLKNPKRYYLLLENLAQKSMSREELSKSMGIRNSGALQLYLQTLLDLHLIKTKIPIIAGENSKKVKYIIWDEFLRFYFYFILPNRQPIQLNENNWLYDQIIAPQRHNFCGAAFEIFCMKNIKKILSILEITKVFKRFGTYWQTKNREKEGMQIDLVIERTDRVTHLIECKWSLEKIGKGVIKDIERKKFLYPNPHKHTLKTAIITVQGVSQEVKKSAIVDDIITLKDLLNNH